MGDGVGEDETATLPLAAPDSAALEYADRAADLGPTSETLSAIITVRTLGMDLVTEDPDAHRLASHWHVATMTVSDLQSPLAA